MTILVLESRMSACPSAFVLYTVRHHSFTHSSFTCEKIRDKHKSLSCGSNEIWRSPLRSDASNARTSWPQISPRENRVQLRKAWTNPAQLILRALPNTETLWLIERSYIFLKVFDVNGRSAVIRLSDGTLFIHAPLALTPDLKAALDKLGEVSIVATPNSEHCDFVAQWKYFYPKAKYLACPGLSKRRQDLPFDGELSTDNTPDASYADDIEQIFIKAVPFFNEVLFYHKQSRSLLVTDVFWNFPEGKDIPTGTSAFRWMMNRIYKPVYERILVRDRKQFEDSMQKVLEKDIQRIIPCHGYIIENGAKTWMTEFFSSLLRT